MYGGPHNHLRTLAGPLAALGVDVVAVVPEGPGGAADRLREVGIEVIQVPLHRMRATRNIRPHVDFFGRLPTEVVGLARILRQRKIDLVVQANLVPPHGGLAARCAGLPLVWQIVDTRSPRSVQVAAMGIVRRTADVTMFCGEALVSWHTGSRAMKMPIAVFYPPVDTERFCISRERREDTRARYGIPSDAPVVGMVGNFNPQKGWEYFVRAASMLYRTNPDVWFMLVGATSDVHVEYVHKIQAEMAASGVPAERFIVTGESNRVELLLPAFDVKLITSVPRSEGAPTCGLEALACGVPIVGVDVAAIGEFVVDDVTGFVVEPLRADAIAAAARRILNDEALRMRLSGAARAHAVKRYDAAVSAQNHLEVFERAQAHRRARRGSVVRRPK